MKTLLKSEFQDVAFQICDILDANKGMDIELINVGVMTTIADYFVLVTATSKPHILGLMEKVEEGLSKNGLKVYRREGVSDGRWVVLDYGNIMIHIFTADLREFYHLEKLWNNGKNSMTFADIQKYREKDAKNKIVAEKKAEKLETINKAKMEKEEKILAKKLAKAENGNNIVADKITKLIKKDKKEKEKKTETKIKKVVIKKSSKAENVEPTKQNEKNK